MGKWKKTFDQFMGLEPDSVSHGEKIISAIGAMLGIMVTYYVSRNLIGTEGATSLFPSMGASAVLVFALPHGKLSQPWPLIGGHLLSAAAGVTCHQFIPNIYLAAGLAVAGAVALMHFLKCIHPPGGATALSAVIAGPPVYDLGYQFLLSPILVNVIIILIFAILFNSFFPWRRYPSAAMMRFTETPQMQQQNAGKYLIDKRYIEDALKKMDLFVDVTADDLQRLMQLAWMEAEKHRLSPQRIILSHYYTNGKKGPEWSVRQIIDEAASPIAERDM